MTTTSNAGSDPFASSDPTGVRTSRSRGRLTAVAVAAAVVIVAMGVGIAALASRPPVADARFVSSDAVFSFPLPDGWYDDTVAYRAYVLDETGDESFLKGYFLLDSNDFRFSWNYCSLSIVDTVDFPGTADDIGSVFASGWYDDFTEWDVTDSGLFTTDAGDDAWFQVIEGVGSEDAFSYLLVVVAGDEHVARLALEVRPEYDVARGALLEALQGATFTD